MSVDYEALRKENERRYGTDIGRIGGMLLANRYDKRTHFIYELLQNAEDALRRRRSWDGSRAVTFDLLERELRISHYGQVFDEGDVRGVCGIDESTKDITSIGRFGIGFKSVYAFSDRPEIHSGNETFAIESYVWPVAVPPRARKPDETVILLPLRAHDSAGHQEITQGLEHLGSRALLFLREVKEISWNVRGGPSGLYFRDDPRFIDHNVRELALMGAQQGKPEVDERWLVFSRQIYNEGKPVGHVEIAFSLSLRTFGGTRAIRALPESPLVVFFPTVVPTHLGFLVQGPYRTTPSRDNVPPNDAWNQHLGVETGQLLLEALRWLAARQWLKAGTLRCLPLDREKFSGGLLASLFDTVANAFKTEALLPCLGSTYAAATRVRLSRTQDLRDLFEPDQLAALHGSSDPLLWLGEGITADRTPELRQYLLHELDVAELTPETVLPRLSRPFLESQSDNWIIKLYEFLNSVPAIIPRLDRVPLVRLEDGSHCRAFIGGKAQAFLPTDAETDFPTARRTVSTPPACRKFLETLGLTKPDPVDDVIRNLLPKYDDSEAASETYAADIVRILRASETDSNAQREKLITALKSTGFVRTTDLGDGSSHVDCPDKIYLAAGRLRELFAGIAGIRIVDDSYDCLRGEDIRELLEDCGATRHICPIVATAELSYYEKARLRREGGCESYTYEWPIQDYTLRGLEELLDQLPTLDRTARADKAAKLWEALIELQDRRPGVFSVRYNWKYFQQRSVTFDASFIRLLNEAAWCPGADGELVPPSLVLFESLGWRANPVLATKIRFKKPIVEELAREAGFDPAVLDLLKKLGLTSISELKSRLQLREEDERPVPPAASGNGRSDTRGANDTTGRYSAEEDGDHYTTDRTDVGSSQPTQQADDHPADDEDDGGGDESVPASPVSEGGGRAGTAGGRARPRARPAQRQFVSYVAVDPQDEEADDPDGLDRDNRMALEAAAINLIRRREPVLEAMPIGNKGFDLIEKDVNEEPERWIEVKAMTGSLQQRPVGLSSVQFEFARRYGEQYWLYVVEHANEPARARIVKIQNPAGRAGTFTFDRGWAEISEIDELLDKVS